MSMAEQEHHQAAQGHQVQTKFQEVFFWVKLKAVPPVKFENNQVKEAIKVDVLVKAHQLGVFERCPCRPPAINIPPPPPPRPKPKARPVPPPPAAVSRPKTPPGPPPPGRSPGPEQDWLSTFNKLIDLHRR